jgi:hypothetical protein
MATYVGNAKKHTKFENTVVIGFNKDHLKILSEHLDEKGWVNILVAPQRENKDKFSVKIDDWKQRNEQRQEERSEQERQGFQPNDPIDDDSSSLPF